VLFAETGLSTAQISSLFIIWSLTSLGLEIPSGVLADAVSRRRLLVIGPLLTAMGYALWTAVPSYLAFAAGFVLWGAKGALQSGALEALVYEELDRHGGASRFAGLLGRSRAAGMIAVALAIGTAGPVFAAGGYAALGAASVFACVVAAAVAVGFPEHRDLGARSPEVSGYRAFAALLASGVTEVARRRPVRRAVMFLVMIAAIWGALDEYVSLLAADTGVATENLPMLILGVYVGAAAGGLMGGPARRLPRRGVAGLLAFAAVALAVGALSGHPLGFVLIGLAFCVFQMTEILAGARLQDAITGPARSTVTSLAGFGTEVAAIGVFALYAAASTVAGHGMIFAGWAAAYALLALAMLSRASRRAAPAPTAASPGSSPRREG
jgi:MFS family permease